MACNVQGSPDAKKPCKGILKTSKSFDKHASSGYVSRFRIRIQSNLFYFILLHKLMYNDAILTKKINVFFSKFLLKFQQMQK